MTSDAARASAPAVRLAYGFGTDRGLRRALNEDSLLVRPDLFAVADGMGGHESGEVASRICVETLGGADGTRDTGKAPLNAAVLLELMCEADARIRLVGSSRAGTTLTGVALTEDAGTPCWLVFNVGDSRTYRLNGGQLTQISVDHSEVQEMYARGEISATEALVHPRRHVITRALGTGTDSEPDFWLLPVQDGDRMLVCSDGLTSEVGDDQIQQILSRLQQPQAAADALIQAALRSGGRDNISVIVVDAVLP